MYGAEAWGPFIAKDVISQCPVRSLQQAVLSLLGGCRSNANLLRMCYMFDQTTWEFHIRRKAVRFFDKIRRSDSAQLMHLCIQHLATFRGTDSWLDRVLLLLREGGIEGDLDPVSLSISGSSEIWFRQWEHNEWTKARSAVREGWSANKPSAQGRVLVHCRRVHFRVPVLLSAVPTFSLRQLVARFISGTFGVARVHGHFQRQDIQAADKRLCLYCLRKGVRVYDDEAHVLLDCPGLDAERMGKLWPLRRFFHVSSALSPQVRGPDRLIPVFQEFLSPGGGRIDVRLAYNLGKFLEIAWRTRAAWASTRSTAPFRRNTFSNGKWV